MERPCRNIWRRGVLTDERGAMSVLYRPWALCTLAVSLVTASPTVLRGGASNLAAPPHLSQGVPTAGMPLSVRLIISTDRTRYAPNELARLNAILRNDGESTVYVNRRMAGFWDGGNLGLEISDEQGHRLPLPFLTHVPPPPLKKGDTSFLIPLETGYSYGTSMELSVRDLFRKPGKYSIRVTYHNWLPRDFIPHQLRGKAVLARDTPALVSEPLWIEVTQ